jgi:hypothetical protein
MGVLRQAITFAALIELTQPHGGKVWLDVSHVTALRAALEGSGCLNIGGKTLVQTTSGPFCVQESVEQVQQLIETEGSAK